MKVVAAASAGRSDRRPVAVDNRWLLLTVQLPAHPSNARVKAWRRLHQLGALPIKHAVYVLPHSVQAIEDFAWVRAEVESGGGQASVFSATAIDDVDDSEIVEQFRTARAADFKQLRADVRRLTGRSARPRSGGAQKHARGLRDRLEHLKSIDFFAAPGAAEAEQAVIALELAAHPSPALSSVVAPAIPIDRAQFTRRTWVTRPRPGVDRFACAWLIRRFIDADAAFAFASEAAALPDAVPFDMYDSGFRHEGARCTFEVLVARFHLDHLTVRRIGEIVHDVDLKDNRFRAPQAATVGALVDGFRAAIADDGALLEQGIRLFEALYRGLQPKARRAPARR